MKSCEYIKGRLGLVGYSDKDVFDGYSTITLDGRKYLLDGVAEEILKNSDNIKYRVITSCTPLRG